jgi:hypothetical protein
MMRAAGTSAVGLALLVHTAALGAVDLDASVAQSAGVLSGDTIHTGQGPASWTELELRPEGSHEGWDLSLPVDLSHRQTYGFALAESRTKLGLKARNRWERHKLLLYLGAYGTWRPGWLDPYQPDAEGEPTPTHRHSFASPRLRAQWDLLPRDGHRFTLEAQLRRPDYLEDPDYDPELAPTHIIPGDHLRASVDLAWRRDWERWRLDLGSSGDLRAYTESYARDAGTGLTHASSEEPNPEYRVLDLEPRARLRWEPGPLSLRAGYGLEIVEDLFDGYYSYLGHHPSLRMDWQASDALSVSGRGELWLRRYGPDSYAERGSHPALDSGDRRWDRRARGSVELRYGLGSHWAIGSQVEARVRETNFPDYLPGVFPSSTSDYEIDWDWRTWQGSLGVFYEG